MEIKTDYEIGQEVYLCYVRGDFEAIEIFKDTIQSVVIENNRILYYTKNFFDEIEQDFVVGLDEKEKLYRIIEKLKEKENDE